MSETRVEVAMVVQVDEQWRAGAGGRWCLAAAVSAFGLASSLVAMSLVAMSLVAMSLVAMSLASPATAGEPAHASPWVTEQTSRTRAIAGGAVAADGSRRIYAGIEIVLEDGWKTYWRNPGSSGVPPRVDWAGSENVAAAELLFPAPMRFVDTDGDTIGYKNTVVLPMALTPLDASKPILLRLAAEFGICREVCIPVQPALSLALPPDVVGSDAGDKLTAALARVPRRDDARTSAPRVQSLKVELAAPKPRIVIEASFPGDPTGGDLFLEAPDGIWIPLAKSTGAGAGTARRFEVDLTDGADIADLKSRTILMTLVSAAGQSEIAFKLD